MSDKEKLDPTTVDGVNATNFKVVGELPAQLTGQLIQNAVSHANRTNVLAENALGAMVKNLNEVDPAEARSLSHAITGDAVAQQIAALAAAVAGLQGMIKGGQTVPPVTP